MRRSVHIEPNFESWRNAARSLLIEGVAPDGIEWVWGEQQSLLPAATIAEATTLAPLKVPAEFISLGRNVACYDDGRRWPLLYRLLYRLTHENRHLLHIESDPDVHEVRRMEKAVKRDIHKFHAFVRFSMIDCSGEEIFTTWYEPQHFTVRHAAPFFVRRFGVMRFSILTPKGCAHWDREQLSFTPGLAKRPELDGDEVEGFWLTYYESIFNPFRLKLTAMKNEMPQRHWPTLPEAKLIRELILRAEGR